MGQGPIHYMITIKINKEDNGKFSIRYFYPIEESWVKALGSTLEQYLEDDEERGKYSDLSEKEAEEALSVLLKQAISVHNQISRDVSQR